MGTPVFLPASRAADPPPNFVVIFHDDMGYGDIGPFGADRVATPHFNRMAAEGTKLTSFYASANVCTPSRCGLLTGRYALRSGLADNVLFPQSPGGLPAGEATIAELLKERGYATACIGKWHLGRVPEHSPTKHGFDLFYGAPYSNDMKPYPLFDGDAIVEEEIDQTTLTRRLTERAVAFIEENRERPFFLYLPHPMPHIPLFAHPDFAGRSRAGLYGDVIEELDWSLGRVMDAIRRAGLDERTLVIATSDNGPWYEGSSGPYRARKGEAWEGGQRVPFLARWPGRIPPGSESATPASNLDILPTLAELAGATLPAGRTIDGRSIAPLLLGEAVPDEFAERPFCMFVNSEIAAVRSGPWKLVLRTFYRGGQPNFEKHGSYAGGLLFDVETDPAESYNVAREHPDVVERLHAYLEQARATIRDETVAVERPAETAPAEAAPVPVPSAP